MAVGKYVSNRTDPWKSAVEILRFRKQYQVFSLFRVKKKFLQKEKHLINCLFQFYSYQSIIFSVRQSSDCKALEELVSHQCGPRWNLESESRIVHTCRTWVEFSVGFYALTEGWSPDFLSSPLPFSPPPNNYGLQANSIAFCARNGKRRRTPNLNWISTE